MEYSFIHSLTRMPASACVVCRYTSSRTTLDVATTLRVYDLATPDHATAAVSSERSSATKP